MNVAACSYVPIMERGTPQITAPTRPLALAREITKKFEEFYRGGVGDAIDHVEEAGTRGEYVVVVEGAGEDAVLAADRVLAIVREETEAGRSLRDSVRAAARVAGWKEQEIYRLVRERGAGPPP